jgi:hypothetical protein
MNVAARMSESTSPADPFARLAPRPKVLGDTGLTMTFVAELLAKHLLDGGVLTMAQLCQRMALPGAILDGVLSFMRKEAKVEVLAATPESGSLRYGLTDRGRATALDALLRGGYIGPAPVPLDRYVAIVKAQTVHGRSVTRESMRRAFADVVLREDLLDQLGPSLNSGRAIFIYGPAGTGKTYVTQRFVRLFANEILIPHAIVVNDAVIAVFDPAIHKLSGGDSQPELKLDSGHDPRFVRSMRPVVISGGELTADMLEIQYDGDRKQFVAPLQLKANNGLFIIDDMGRQRVAPATVFNRWIVPLEEKKDYLTLGAGRHFSVPFDVILIFSTNLHPLDLADEAYLRRIGYKIEFGHLTPQEYARIWTATCEQLGIMCDAGVLEFALHQLHGARGVPLLPCHPRDLLNIAIDQASYLGDERRVTRERLAWAWQNYFVSIKGGHANDAAPVYGGSQ